MTLGKRILAFGLTLLVMLLSACADGGDGFVPRDPPAGSIVLRLTGGGQAQTRSTLEGSQALHHVQQVYAILYQGEGDAATYVCHQDLGWNPGSEADYGDGQIQKRSFELTIPSTLTNGKYTLLCVGLDDKSGTTYGLTLDAGQTPAFLADGHTLAEARAILATTAGISDMTHAEPFAGWATFDYDAEQVNDVSVELLRRVAGVYAYLKDVPAEAEGRPVTSVSLVCGNRLPTTLDLKSKAKAQDFGTGALDPDVRVLARWTVPEGTPVKDNRYEVDPLLLAAYLLPADAGADPTFSIILQKDDGTQVSFPAVWTAAPTGVDKKMYPVYANHIYHIGTLDRETNSPASLAGDRLVLDVQEWTPMDVDTDFPKVNLNASIDTDKNPSTYIYDCINCEDVIRIMPSLLHKGWRLIIVNDDGTSCNWLFFKKEDGTYCQELKSTDFPSGNESEVDVTIRMSDYVKKRTYSEADKANEINNDWRRARIQLWTDDSATPMTLSIHQYNAITVEGLFWYDDDKKSVPYSCGVSRFDMDAVRDKDGNKTAEGSKHFWGFWSSWFWSVHRGHEWYDDNCEPCYDGVECYMSVLKGAPEIYTESVVNVALLPAWEWDVTENKNRIDTYRWYLPSQYELYSFFNDIVNWPDVETHLVDPAVEANALYWSATAHCDAYADVKHMRSYCQRTGAGVDKENCEYRTKDKDAKPPVRNYGYVRRARRFAE